MHEQDSRYVGLDDDVLIKTGSGWVMGVVLAITPKLCVVELSTIPIGSSRSVNAKGQHPKAVPTIDPDRFSDSSAWPPDLPDDFPLTLVNRGYMARIHKQVRWVCGMKSPRRAYLTYLAMTQEPAPAKEDRKGYSIGDHIAVPWSRVFVGVQAPDAVVAREAVRQVSQWAYLPTTEAPEAIRSLKGLCSGDSLPLGQWCVYFLCLMGRVVYVGMTRKLPNRIKQHQLVKKFDAVFHVPCHRTSARKKERRHIRALKPAYNGNCISEVERRLAGIPLSTEVSR